MDESLELQPAIQFAQAEAGEISKTLPVRFKKLVIQGFKSFPERIVFEFGSAICAVVGPNGCGKSNVLDALRWVLGEQGPTQLRAQSMADVIFNGSATRKPLGLAEVTLTVESPCGTLMGGYNEVEVTRRLYRSNDSEYLINRTPCRLKDITDLFLDVGLGKGAYSLIEQGRVDAILTARPDERRGLLEQAAGIVKYKSRKKEALSKLTSTENNLNRVHDILNEVRSRRTQLARQARKAERYREIQAELSELKLMIRAARFLILRSDRETLRKQLGDEEFGLANTIAAAGVKQAAVEQARTRSDDTYSLLKSIREEAGKLEFRIDYITRRITDLGTRNTELSDESKRIDSEITTLESRSSSTCELLSELQTGAVQLREEIDLRRKTEAELSQRIDDVTADLVGQRRLLRELKEKYLAHLEENTRRKNEAVHLEDAVRRTQSRSEKLMREHQGMLDEESASSKDSAACRAHIEALNRDLARSEQEIRQCRDESAVRKSALDEMTGRMHEVDARLVELKSRLNSLEEIIAAGEGLGEGVKAIMHDFARRPGCNGHIAGLLADLFETEPRFEKAVAAALETRMQDIVIRDRGEALEAIDYLTESARGRCTFTPVSSREQVKGKLIENHPFQAVSECLRTDGEFRPMFDRLLSNIYWMEDLRGAVSAAEVSGSGEIFVTLNGEIVTSEGSMTGGPDVSAQSGYRARKREITHLREELQEWTVRRNDLAMERQTTMDALDRAEKKHAEAERERSVLRVALAEANRDQTHLEQSLKRAQLRREAVETERQILDEEIYSLREKLESLGRAEAAQPAESGLPELLKTAETELERKLQGMETLQQDLSEQRIKIEGAVQRYAANQRETTRVQEELTGFETAIRKLNERISQINQAGEVNRSNTEALQRELSGAMDQSPVLQIKIQQLSSRWDIEKTALDELQKELDSIQPRIRLIEQKISEIKIRMAEIEAAMNMLREQSETDPDETGKQWAVLPEDSEVEAWKTRCASLDTEMAALGDVNLAAVEEHREMVERNRFLDGQVADLEQAILSLKTTITQINRTSRSRFLEAYEAVNSHFHLIFNQLFEGGEAHLELQNPEDPLETGIEIICRPPGKRARNIDLLSGGEKALSALALLFASFQFRPSPILFLDEVDAPLDDANVVRFSKYLRQCSSGTQVVMVTHNPLSMEIADVLYGVTMPEPGVSRLVSAKFAS